MREADFWSRSLANREAAMDQSSAGDSKAWPCALREMKAFDNSTIG